MSLLISLQLTLLPQIIREPEPTKKNEELWGSELNDLNWYSETQLCWQRVQTSKSSSKSLIILVQKNVSLSLCIAWFPNLATFARIFQSALLDTLPPFY